MEKSLEKNLSKMVMIPIIASVFSSCETKPQEINGIVKKSKIEYLDMRDKHFPVSYIDYRSDGIVDVKHDLRSDFIISSSIFLTNDKEYSEKENKKSEDLEKNLRRKGSFSIYPKVFLRESPYGIRIQREFNEIKNLYGRGEK